MSKTFKEHGWDTCSIDIDARMHPDLDADIGVLTPQDIHDLMDGFPDVIWSSPPCECFSVASMGHHWISSGIPRTQEAKDMMALHEHTIRLIRDSRPIYWFIENPRAMLRKMPFMQGLKRCTISYCQYGERRQKPTDIWTNHPDPKFKPICKPGSPCHDEARRGAKTGTQGIKGAFARGMLPKGLCEHIVEICEVKG